MVWYVISAVAFLAAVAMVVVTYVRDRRYLKMKASQAMDPRVYEELEEEEREARARRERFKGALEEAKKGEGGNS